MDIFVSVIRIAAATALGIVLVVAYATVHPGPAVGQEVCEYCVDLNEPDHTPTCGEPTCDTRKHICCLPEIIAP